MKVVVLILLFFAAFHLEADPAPLLDFSPYLPIELTPENKAKLEEANTLKAEARRNVDEFNSRQIPWWPLIATLLVTLAFLFIRQFVHKPTPEELLKMRAEKAKVVALQALAQLQAANLPAKGQIDSYFVELSSILRHYLENRYRLHTPVETTPEFLHEITLHPEFGTHVQSELAALFKEADNVKFARYSPTFKECQQALSKAYEVIESTP